MLEELQRMIREAKKAKEWIEETRGQIRVVSHYDADGICSGSIMVKTLLRRGKDFHLTFVKQLSERILESLAEEERELFVFLDMGSGQLEMIKKHLDSKVIICDHHQPKGEANENVIHINSVLTGIEDNISGSGVTYILSRTIDPKNIDLSEFAVIGAIGDSQIDAIGKDWGVSGLNREILKDAQSEGKIKVSKGIRLWGRFTRPLHRALAYSMDPYIPGITGSESASVQFLQEIGIPLKKDDGSWRTIADLSFEEQKKLADGIIKERIRADHENPEFIFGDVYDLLDKEGEFRDANEFATILNACGKMGFASLGVSLCLNEKEAYGKAREVLEKYRKEIGKGVSWVRSNLENPGVVRKKKGIYILAGSNIPENLISNVISIVNHSGFFPEKPLFGIADSEEGVKISARVSDSLVEKGVKLDEIMNEISGKLGGEGGGHMAAAAAVIPKEKQEEFINMTEQILTNIIGGEHGNEKQTETERRAGREEGGEAREGSETGGERREGGAEEMERKGLVQYFGTQGTGGETSRPGSGN